MNEADGKCVPISTSRENILFVSKEYNSFLSSPTTKTERKDFRRCVQHTRYCPIHNSPFRLQDKPFKRNYILTMDCDIPIVTATVVGAIPVPVERPALSKGRSSRFNLPKQQSYVLRESEISALQDQGFTGGLAKTLTDNNASFPLRIWVVDNSGSMRIADGHRIVETSKSRDIKLVDCTRWSEIQQTVEYHAQMAHLLKAPTVFRLLNDPGRVVGSQQFSIGENGSADIDHDLAVALQTIKNVSPGGVTPLTEHLQEIRSNILTMDQSLRRDGTKVAIIVLATDGLPTDSQGLCDNSTKFAFKEAMRSMEGLPVWIIVRLCTDEDDVVEFYNNLDAQLELSIEVLNDFTQEAKEVCAKNAWLNYTLPLHQCREMGYYNRPFDLLDERLLSPDELREFLFLLFGAENFDGVPDPQADWKGFVKGIQAIVSREKKQWNPVTKKLGPWVDVVKMDKLYKKNKCTIM